MSGVAETTGKTHGKASVLLTTLSTLRLQDGRPDTARRRAELAALVDTIDPHELLYLRSCVRARSVRLAGLDDLPAELLSLISEGLDIGDIASCIRVCRGWRGAWTSDDVARTFARRLFPGLLEVAAHSRGIATKNSWSLFNHAARQKAHRRSRFFTSVLARNTGPAGYADDSFFTADPAAHPNGVLPKCHSPDEVLRPSHYAFSNRLFPTFYSHGRVAWQLDACCVVLDSLKSRHRRVVSYPGARLRGELTCLVAITQSLLVFNMKGTHKLIIYHIETQQFKKLELPSSLVDIYADDLNLGLVLLAPSIGGITETHSEGITPAWKWYVVYHWRWDGALREHDAYKIDEEEAELIQKSESISRPHGYLFHPWDENRIFHVTMLVSRTDENYIHISVHEYDGTQHVKSYHHTERYPLYDLHNLQSTLKPLCQRVNSYGDYLLCAPSPTLRWLAYFQFNVVTKQFSVSKVPSDPTLGLDYLWPDMTFVDPQVVPFVWNGILYYHTEETAFTGKEFLRVAPTDIQPHEIGPYTNPMTCYGIPTAVSASASVFASTTTARQNPGSIDGDDEFVVLGTSNYYVVWYFGDDMEAKRSPWGGPGGIEAFPPSRSAAIGYDEHDMYADFGP